MSFRGTGHRDVRNKKRSVWGGEGEMGWVRFSLANPRCVWLMHLCWFFFRFPLILLHFMHSAYPLDHYGCIYPNMRHLLWIHNFSTTKFRPNSAPICMHISQSRIRIRTSGRTANLRANTFSYIHEKLFAELSCSQFWFGNLNDSCTQGGPRESVDSRWLFQMAWWGCLGGVIGKWCHQVNG